MSNPFITLSDYGEGVYEEKKSVFTGRCMPVKTEEEALAFLSKIRRENADARHNVYAYILRENNIARYSDDGEPQGTAGVPVLEVLKKNGISDAIIVVTRYFGGILLGTGGLVRAYGAAASEAILAAGIARLVPYGIYEIRAQYGQIDKLRFEICRMPVLTDGIDYGENVRLTVAVPDTYEERFLKRLLDIGAGKLPVVKTGERLDAEPSEENAAN